MKKIIRISVLVMCLLMVFAPVSILAAPYTTYTYSIDGWPMQSPDAYTPYKQYDSSSMGLVNPLSSPSDMECDNDGNVYIADRENNRVVVLDKYFKLKFEITSFVNGNGIPDALVNPYGVFATDNYIYVADTGNSRIAIFNKDGSFSRILDKPESPLFGDDAIYTPVALAVDEAGTGSIYVVSSTTTKGIIVLNGDTGELRNFIGAQKVEYNLFDIIWRNFQTSEQKAKNENYVSTEYNNITIDEKGFVFVTTSSIDENLQQQTIYAKSTSGDYAPVKKLNASGNDIMDRTGFYPPSGEVKVSNMSYDGSITGASRVTDVAIGPDETWSIIDEKRSKIYTYDKLGNLLFIFGDTGTQMGALQYIGALTYRGDEILVLDKNMNNVTTYKRTEYGDLLVSAVALTNERDYTGAAELWEDVLQRNNNFDMAYVGIGKAYYREGKWVEAMEKFKAAYDTNNYSNAFQMYRKEWLSKYAIIVPIVVVVVCFALAKFFGFAGKVNKAASVRAGKKTFGEELLYGFHLIIHPFDGFWDLKHEKRGSLRAALVYVLLAVAAFSYQSIGAAYIFNPRGNVSSIYVTIISILVPILLWTISNWCLTTLFDGEGSLKDIFIATSYSLLPLVLTLIPATILTNFITADGAGIVTLINTIGWIWTGMLIFFGMMTTHDYTLFKGIVTSLGTIVGMAFVIFITLLFSSLIMKIVTFISNIVTEISYRL